MKWSGGFTTDPSNPKHVPKVMSMYGLRGNILRVGIFQQFARGATTQNIETIYSYSCKELR